MADRGWRHGTTYAYSIKKCRCDLCSEVGRRYFREAARRRYHAGPPLEGITHGASGAMNYGCKCSICHAGLAAYMRQQNANRAARGVPEGLHGKASTYTNYKCRCDECKEAHNAPRRVSLRLSHHTEGETDAAAH